MGFFLLRRKELNAQGLKVCIDMIGAWISIFRVARYDESSCVGLRLD